MTTLFIDRRQLQLKADNEALVFYDQTSNEKLGTVPIRLLERVCIKGDVQLTASVLGKLGEHGIGLLLLSGRKRAPVLMMPNLKVDGKRRFAQFAAAQDSGFCLQQARGWIQQKAERQQHFIQQAAEQHAVLSNKVAAMQQLLTQIANSSDIEQLRGYEGVAAAHYFSAWQHILPASLNFHGRNRRPPRDPFNTVLSLGYTLLHFELVRRIYLAGLDPFIGYFHAPAHGRESLASDLLEPLRPQYDQWAADCFRQKILRPEDFSTQQEACMMGKAGRIRYYSEVEHFIAALQPQLTEAIRRLLADLSRHSNQDPADFDYQESHWEEEA